jgi:hypothetical protein
MSLSHAGVIAAQARLRVHYPQRPPVRFLGRHCHADAVRKTAARYVNRGRTPDSVLCRSDSTCVVSKRGLGDAGDLGNDSPCHGCPIRCRPEYRAGNGVEFQGGAG